MSNININDLFGNDNISNEQKEIKTIKNLIAKHKGRVLFISRSSEKYKSEIKLIYKLTSYLPEDSNLPQRLYHINTGLTSIPKCKHCKINSVNFNGFSKGYRTYCSSKCQTNDMRETAFKTRYNNITNNFTGDIYKDLNIMILSDNISYVVFYHYYKELIDSVTLFLNNNASGTEKVFCAINNLKQIPLCPHCNKPTKFLSFTRGYGTYCSQDCQRIAIAPIREQTCIKKYGVKYAQQNDIIKQRIKDGVLKKYGTENVFQSEEIKKKIKKRMNELYGCDSPMQNSKIKKKAKETYRKRTGYDNPLQNPSVLKKVRQSMMIRYGVEYPTQSEEIKQRIRTTNMSRYNVSYYTSSEEFKIKSKATNLKLYGVEYATQNPDILSKSLNGYKSKDYKLPSGKVITIQGYEGYGLDILLKKYNEVDILTDKKDMPDVWYTDADKKQHRYFCDIFIPSDNTLIEIKSRWTYDRYKKCNILKQEAAKNLGYIHEIWIIDSNGSIEEII